MVKIVECRKEKNELIKAEVDRIFNSFNIGPNEELKRSVYLEPGFYDFLFYVDIITENSWKKATKDESIIRALFCYDGLM